MHFLPFSLAADRLLSGYGSPPPGLVVDGMKRLKDLTLIQMRGYAKPSQRRPGRKIASKCNCVLFALAIKESCAHKEVGEKNSGGAKNEGLRRGLVWGLVQCGHSFS